MRKIDKRGDFLPRAGEVVYDNGSEDTFRVYYLWVASYKGKWYYGYCMPHCRRTCSTKGPASDSREAAIDAAIQEMRSRLPNRRKFKRRDAEYKAYEAFQRWALRRNQMSLFAAPP